MITRDNNNNIAYTFELEKNAIQNIGDYWTPEKKNAAIPIMPGVERIIAESNEETTDPEKADLSKAPFSAGGKLFFTMDGKDYVASANIMGSRNLLLTAAHCIQDQETGNLGDHFLFERCYDSGNAAEKLTFRTVALKEFWVSEKKWKWDYAIAILNSDSTVDSPLKYSTEDISGKTVTAFGYPTNYYKGKSMVFVKGGVTRQPKSTWLIDGCKMRGGCSGGAWVLDDNNTVVGVNSYGPVSESEAYGGSPIFDENFESLYKYVLTLK